jgi:hypothetical protein
VSDLRPHPPTNAAIGIELLSIRSALPIFSSAHAAITRLEELVKVLEWERNEAHHTAVANYQAVDGLRGQVRDLEGRIEDAVAILRGEEPYCGRCGE